MEELHLGKFDFNQEARTAKSYVRHLNDDNVYVVDGFLSMSLGGDLNSFRNRSLTNLSEDEITSLSVEFDGTSRRVRKENYWVDDDNQVLDTAQMDQYVTTISKLNGATYQDNFDPAQSNKIAALSIYTSTAESPIEISCYAISGSEKLFVIHSSENQESYFSSDSSGLFKRIFQDITF
jgi:hypothetical protein